MTAFSSLINSYGMHKRAGGGLANDSLGSSVWGSIPYVGGLSNMAGAVHGLIKGPASEEELREMDKHPGYAYLPGVGASRLIRKVQSTGTSENKRKHAISEVLAPAAHVLAAATAGAVINGVSNFSLTRSRNQKILDLLIGGAVGAGIGALPTLIGSAIGTARRNRSSAEQDAHDNNASIAANWFIPGVAGYNTAQRMRSALRDEYIRNENPTD